jgi:large subunit ribosomal protein L3
MPGHMGDERVTQPNLKVLKIDAEKGLLYVKGSVPGMDSGYVLIRDAVKRPSEPATFGKSE